MSLRERQPYMEESERLKQLHARQYPTYKVIYCYHRNLIRKRKQSNPKKRSMHTNLDLMQHNASL
jgi:hypothetical protein